MKKLLARLLVLLLVITMLPIAAFASLDNHNVPDVTIVKSQDDNNYYFPDIVKLPDGRLLVAYYQSLSHKDHIGAIYTTESRDNGKTWTTPRKAIDRSAESKDSRDPNLAILPDGTVVLTYFGGGDCIMTFSRTNGRSWSNEIKIESDILDLDVSKRGTIAVIDKDNMLVPVYGSASGNNAYGAPATADGTNAFGNSWQVDAAILHYQRQSDGTWEVVYESSLGQSLDETAVLFTGNGGDVTTGTDGYPTYAGDVWAFSREDGSVRVSHDNCRSWQLVAKEEPRAYTNSGIILWGEQIIQPRFTKLGDGCWLATYANYTNMNFPYDRLSRPVYAKVFFPEAGWYATQSRLIYDGVGHGIQDMADPASVVTNDGKVLIIYYDITLQAIAGTFTDLEDWVKVDDTTGEVGYKEGNKWTFATQNATDFTNIRNWSTTTDDGIYTSTTQNLISGKSISGQYKAQFEFTLDGSAANSSEGLWIYPLYGTTNPNRTGAIKFRISTNNGIQAYCGDNPKSGVVKENVSLTAGTAYNAKVSKDYDTLSLKIWEVGTAEPLGWNMVWMDKAIGNKVDFPADAKRTYDHSVSGEVDNNGNPCNWNFYLVNASSGSHGVTIRGLELYKNVVMELNHTELTVNQGETPKNVELNAMFYPNIFQQLPKPSDKVQYSSANGNAAVSAISHATRPHRANVTGVNAGRDVLTVTHPGIVDASGSPVKATCQVTVRPANDAVELTFGTDGYITETIYVEDFNSAALFENSSTAGDGETYTIEDLNYNPMSSFFEYKPFYEMSHLGVRADESDTSNHCLKAYSGSSSQYAGNHLISNDRIQGDLTFTADVYLPADGEVRVNVAGQQAWYKPDGEAAYVLGSALSNHEKQSYVDYEFGFQHGLVRGLINSGATTQIYIEPTTTSGWISVKVVKAGDTLYAKSWLKGGTEPGWEMIIQDERLAQADQELGGSYITLELRSGYADTAKYSAAGEVLVDNISITRQTAPKYSVTLNANGGTIAEGKDITEYTRGESVALPTADEITKDGYEFAGWYDNRYFDGEPVVEIPTTASSDLTYFAKWKERLLSDITSSNEYYEAAEYLVSNKIMDPIVDARFGPQYAAYRSTVVSVLWGMENEPEVEHEMSFTDVSGQSYTEAIRWANANEIIYGVSTTKFSPMAELTKEHLLTILYRYAKLKNYSATAGDGVTLQFTDASAISAYAVDAVKWACGVGIIENSATALNPRNAMTRGDYAQILMNFCKTFVE